MKSDDTRTCLVCGTQFPRSKEFCPICILREAMDEQIEAAKTFLKGVPPNRSGRRLSHRFEHYELITDKDGKPVELGRGAMGVTYKGFDVDLQCPVTLKVINEQYLGDESARLRFLREARAAAKVRHTNVASVLHLGRTGRRYFYAMEFVEGETLDNLIKRSGRLDLKLALEIVAQVAAGLAAVHKQNLVHRDIKPSNIMVKLEGGGALMAKIIDLGLAKFVGEPGSQSKISARGGFAGTPEFASPEQFAGVGVDIRSDLYSLQLRLVTIDLDADDDAQVIFETLNSRGADLLPADLIKNYLFRRAQTDGIPVEQLYDRYWKAFDHKWWREDAPRSPQETSLGYFSPALSVAQDA
jgi:serine/threonine protein kinase